MGLVRLAGSDVAMAYLAAHNAHDGARNSAAGFGGTSAYA